MADWIWATLAGSVPVRALVVGAVIASTRCEVPARIVASVMAFGAVLVSALAFDLVLEAQAEGGFWPTVGGFAVGAVVYVVANTCSTARPAQPAGSAENPGTGVGIALGALLDGIPESAVLGLSMVGGTGVSVPVLLAIVISNVPEGLSSTAALKDDGRSAATCSPSGSASRSRAPSPPLLGFVLLDGASGGRPRSSRRSPPARSSP